MTAEQRTASGAWRAAHERSLQDPDGFWREAAGSGRLDQRAALVALDDDRPPSPLVDRRVLKNCWNAWTGTSCTASVDQPAVVDDSPGHRAPGGPRPTPALDEVARVGGVLRTGGCQQADRVVIYMPMVPEAVVAMLACAGSERFTRWCSAGSRRPSSGRGWIDEWPMVVVSASCGMEPTRVVEDKRSWTPHRAVRRTPRRLRRAPAPAGRGGDGQARRRLGDGDARGRR